MRAAVLYGKEDVRVEEIAPKPLAAGEVRVTIKAALTCGTDLKVYKRGYHARMLTPPTVFGHELAGIVSEVNATEGGPGWAVGERVVVANSAPCGECFFCRHEQANLCDDLLFLNGAYAESIVVPARLVQKNMLRLKPETSFADAALVEPLACVVQGVQDSRLKRGQRVLVIGSGPIGLMFVALATHLGCLVSVSGRGEQRLELAQKLGALHILPALAPEAPLPQPSLHLPFDVVIEAVGKPQTWEAAVRLVRKGGTVNFFGGCPAGTTVSLDTSLIHYSGLMLLASFHHTPQAIRQALNFIERGVIRAADFIDGQCGLSELPGLLASMARGNHAVKTLIRVHE